MCQIERYRYACCGKQYDKATKSASFCYDLEPGTRCAGDRCMYVGSIQVHREKCSDCIKGYSPLAPQLQHIGTSMAGNSSRANQQFSSEMLANSFGGAQLLPQSSQVMSEESSGVTTGAIYSYPGGPSQPYKTPPREGKKSPLDERPYLKRPTQRHPFVVRKPVKRPKPRSPEVKTATKPRKKRQRQSVEDDEDEDEAYEPAPKCTKSPQTQPSLTHLASTPQPSFTPIFMPHTQPTGQPFIQSPPYPEPPVMHPFDFDYAAYMVLYDSVVNPGLQQSLNPEALGGLGVSYEAPPAANPHYTPPVFGGSTYPFTRPDLTPNPAEALVVYGTNYSFEDLDFSNLEMLEEEQGGACAFEGSMLPMPAKTKEGKKTQRSEK